MNRLASDPRMRVAALTLSCFLLASTGWLLWLYHIAKLASPASVDVLTMGVGYLMQAIGIGATAFYGRGANRMQLQRLTVGAIVAFVACLVPSTLSPNLTSVLAFGYLANLLSGCMQSYYLFCLARFVEAPRRGLVFGAAYAVSTGLSWLLSAVGGGMLTRGIPGLVCCGALALLTLALVRMPLGDAVAEEQPRDASDRTTLYLACIVVALMSLTKGAGFSFPSVDLGDGVNLELSRLLYGVGLLIAGIVSDYDRKIGALCCAGALVMPFLMLALAGAEAPATIMWALGYLFNGFFSVFRVLLLADLASEQGKPQLACLGLLFGRVGDSLGTIISIVLSSVPLVLITTVSVLFALTIMLFFALYQRLYTTAVEATLSERELFERFATRHDLSSREREVLRLVLEERTNSEIASELFVSEATVKYHVRNLLRKTGCHNRLEILALYHGATS